LILRTNKYLVILLLYVKFVILLNDIGLCC